MSCRSISMMALPLAVALPSVFGAGMAQAYRPFDLTDAEVARRRNFEIELGPAEFISVGSEHSVRAPSLAINYGFGPDREIGLEGANHVAFNPTPGESRMQLEGVAIAVKHVMRRGRLQDKPGVSIAMEEEIEFPDRREDHLGAAGDLILSSAGRRGAAHVNLAVERLPEGLNAGLAGVIFEASDHFGVAPALELYVAAVDGERRH